MTLTELRDTLSAVSDALPVPAPDAVAFQGRVRRARRRRTTGMVAGVAAAALVVAGGATLALGRGDSPDRRGSVAHQPSVPRSADVPVLVENHVREVSADGVLGAELLGPVGPDIATIVGTTPQGVVVLTDAGSLARINGAERRIEPLVGDQVVRAAYLDGDAVVYENERSLIRWRGIEPTVRSNDSAQSDEGRLLAGALDRYVVADPAGGLVAGDADGFHELRFDRPPTTVHSVELGGDVIAVNADDELVFFDAQGRQTEEASGGERLGALAPDGHAYAQVRPGLDGVQLVDPRSADAEPVDGVSGDIADLGWASDGDLLVVVQGYGDHTLWRCAADGTGCAASVEDPTGTLRLR